MKRHRLIGAAILSLTATAAAAPIAYFLGASHGGAAAASSPFLPFPRAVSEMTDAVWDCESFIAFPGLRTIDRARPCGPGAGTPAEPAAAPRRRAHAGPLRQASIAAIAGGDPVSGAKELKVPAAFASETPLSLTPAPAPVELAFAPQPGGPYWPGGGGIPFILPTGELPGPGDPPIPPDNPDDLVVPLPAGIWLFGAGLAGLAFARRAARPGPIPR